MSLTLVYGPMFSGKSTYIIDNVRNMEEHNLLVVKHYLDNRYAADGLISHDKQMIDAVKLSNLCEIFDMDGYDNFDTIFIDEGQFFDDIFEFVKAAVEFDNKKVVVAGLVSDFKMRPFRNILDLFAMADNIIEKELLCDCGNKAMFNKRLCNSQDKVLIGSKNYRSVCRNCFNKPEIDIIHS